MDNQIKDFQKYLFKYKKQKDAKGFEVLVCNTLINILNDFEGDFKDFKHDYLRFQSVEDGTIKTLTWNEDINYIFERHGAEVVAICFECLERAEDIAGFIFPIHQSMVRSAFYLVMSSLVDDFVLGGLDNE